jgi:hypothetical protein
MVISTTIAVPDDKMSGQSSDFIKDLLDIIQPNPGQHLIAITCTDTLGNQSNKN